MTTENHLAAPSFDRMRNMLVRAAEVRDSEQQQIFDALDDIYARLAPVDSLGAVRKRLSELPDRTEVGVLAERLDEAMTRMEAQDKAIASVAQSVDAIVDKLAKPFAQLDGRLDGVAGKFEGVAGRMDGLEDKLQNIHRRLDELDGHLDKQDGKVESLPNAVHEPVRERIETAESTVREQIDAAERQVRTRIDEAAAASKDRVDGGTERLENTLAESTQTLDASDRLDKLGDRVAELAARLDKIEEGFTTQLGDFGGTLKGGLSRVEDTIAGRPDTESVGDLVRKSNEESERRIGGQLDEAMATFAELMLGGTPAPQPVAAAPAPRQPRRARSGRTTKSTESKSKTSNGESDEEAAEA